MCEKFRDSEDLEGCVHAHIGWSWSSPSSSKTIIQVTVQRLLLTGLDRGLLGIALLWAGWVGDAAL